jgi:hypothetical protein
VADFGTGPGRGRGAGRLTVRTRFVLPARGLGAGGLGRDVLRAGWRRERCLDAAGAVLARTAAVEKRLDWAVAKLPVDALTEHPRWNFPTIYASPAAGVPGVLDADARAGVIAELADVTAAAHRLSVAVARLRLVCDEAVSEAACWISDDTWDARFAVERCTGREEAADAADRLPGDRARLIAAVRTELGLPPLAALTRAVDYGTDEEL